MTLHIVKTTERTELPERATTNSYRVVGSSALKTEYRQRSDAEQDALEFAKSVLRAESDAVLAQIDRLDDSFCDALELFLACRGRVVVSGMGKAGLIGRKLSATLSSTGTPSHFVHPGEAFHGDLGAFQQDDVALVLSHSGETEEVKKILASLVARNIPIVAVVSTRDSSLGRAATVVLETGKIDEADSLGLAPSSSTTAMLAVGDALALATSREKGFRAEDFALFHPGGALGRRLSRVDDCMRSLERCRVASDESTVRELFVGRADAGRRSGAILLVDKQGALSGIFTDSDLAKLFERNGNDAFDRPVRDVMTKTPLTIASGAMMRDAVELMTARKISELPVVGKNREPLGLVDITDIGDFFPQRDAR